jgi:hypothetical protein
VIGDEMNAYLSQRGIAMPSSANAMAHYIILGFLFGIAMVYLYALIRPRVGPGPRAAIIAGLVIWLFAGLFHMGGEAPMGIFPTRFYVLWTLWWLFEIPIATLAGAWLYRESPSPAPAM